MFPAYIKIKEIGLLAVRSMETEEENYTCARAKAQIPYGYDCGRLNICNIATIP